MWWIHLASTHLIYATSTWCNGPSFKENVLENIRISCPNGRREVHNPRPAVLLIPKSQRGHRIHPFVQPGVLGMSKGRKRYTLKQRCIVHVSLCLAVTFEIYIHHLFCFHLSHPCEQESKINTQIKYAFMHPLCNKQKIYHLTCHPLSLGLVQRGSHRVHHSRRSLRDLGIPGDPSVNALCLCV